VALELDFESAHEMSHTELVDFVARQSDGELMDPEGSPYYRTPGMDVSPFVIDTRELSEEEDRHASKAGLRRLTLVRFRERARASEEESVAGWVMMLNLVLEFLRRYPAEDALLVHNGERVLMRHRQKETVFDAWDGLDEEPGLAAIVNRYPREQLAQPFL
jgi:hypothetical protein